MLSWPQLCNRLTVQPHQSFSERHYVATVSLKSLAMGKRKKMSASSVHSLPPGGVSPQYDHVIWGCSRRQGSREVRSMGQSRISFPHKKYNIRGSSHDLFPVAGVVQIINKANLAREQVRARTWGPSPHYMGPLPVLYFTIHLFALFEN